MVPEKTLEYYTGRQKDSDKRIIQASLGGVSLRYNIIPMLVIFEDQSSTILVAVVSDKIHFAP